MDVVAIDLDGTLLNREHTISAGNAEAIKQAQQDGVDIVIATGRAYFDVHQIFADLPIRPWVISANGAVIHTPDGTLFEEKALDRGDAGEALKWLEKEAYYYEVFSGSSIYTPQNGRELLHVEMDRLISANPETDKQSLKHALDKQFSQNGFAFVESYEEIVESKDPMYNILAFTFDLDKLEKGKEKFHDHPSFTMVSSAEHNFELEDHTASKGSALKSVADHLCIPMDRTAAVGDSHNDLSMLEAAGRSAAMENAVDDVKKASDYITKSNDDDGVAYAITHYFS
ncbi:Cof-type HAD-IIB family hydrolase [Halobacillus litoralis]|uniref:Cof-type HAD-IIB family hydrolase n=1 Tax=Halobacillus litoralis TaxID=45668 RepID=A0A845DWG4_9BACI|nr:Cof-type HAD-IIB family hydrolase [Halobacillus litoralis]MYL20662.1 Cof-type HAD-IIB family hydrolase [Halobacillus litoralis]